MRLNSSFEGNAWNCICTPLFIFIASWLVEQKRNVMAHAQKPDLVFQRNGRVRLYRRGCQFSRLLTAEVCASAVVMLDRPCPIQCPTAGYPLHSPFSPSLLHPCVSVCHHIPFLLYPCLFHRHYRGCNIRYNIHHYLAPNLGMCETFLMYSWRNLA